MELFIQSLPAFGILALVFVFFKNNWVSKQEVGNEKMARIAKNIADGAMSFLKAEYKILSIFVAAVAVLLFFIPSNERAAALLPRGVEEERFARHAVRLR